MTDLRAKVEGLPVIDGTLEVYDVPAEPTVFSPIWVRALDRDAVLALIPEDAVLVTVETLAAALIAHGHGGWHVMLPTCSAAIIAKLREGTE